MKSERKQNSAAWSNWSAEVTEKEAHIAALEILAGFKEAKESGEAAYELGWYGFISRDDVLQVATFLADRARSNPVEPTAL
jgi:hypothetical protein